MHKKQFTTPLSCKGVNSGEARHLRSIDGQIRKRWNQLYFYRKGRAVHTDEVPHSKKVNTEPNQCNEQAQYLNLREVQHFKANMQREATVERIKRNNDIFFRKKKYEADSGGKLIKHNSCSPKRIAQFNLEDRDNEDKTVTSKEVKLPLMLQKRGKKLQKEMSIIQHVSSKEVRNINVREALKMELKEQDKEKLISRMKGTKLYYKFIQQWKMPLYEAEPPPSALSKP